MKTKIYSNFFRTSKNSWSSGCGSASITTNHTAFKSAVYNISGTYVSRMHLIGYRDIQFRRKFTKLLDRSHPFEVIFEIMNKRNFIVTEHAINGSFLSGQSGYVPVIDWVAIRNLRKLSINTTMLKTVRLVCNNSDKKIAEERLLQF